MFSHLGVLETQYLGASVNGYGERIHIDKKRELSSFTYKATVISH